MVSGHKIPENNGNVGRVRDGRSHGAGVRWLFLGLASTVLLSGAVLWSVGHKVSITPATGTMTTASIASGTHEEHATMEARGGANCVTLAIGREGAQTRALPCTTRLPDLRETASSGRADLAELKNDFLSGIASAIAQSDERTQSPQSATTVAD